MALVFGELFLALTNKPVPPVRPQVICLTIDVSGSMAGAKLNEVKQVSNNVISRRDLSIDTLALVTFSDNASVQVQVPSAPNRYRHIFWNTKRLRWQTIQTVVPFSHRKFRFPYPIALKSLLARTANCKALDEFAAEL